VKRAPVPAHDPLAPRTDVTNWEVTAGLTSAHRMIPSEERGMATSVTIEEESGTDSGPLHPHNGYYAGDFAREVDLRTSGGYQRDADGKPHARGHDSLIAR
jgi:hypothetical protein